MKSWIDSLSYLSQFLSVSVFLLFFCTSQSFTQSLNSKLEGRPAIDNFYSSPAYSIYASDTTVTAKGKADLYPDPTSVMYSSMIIPGWGQIRNKQIWKVPIIYGLLGGLAWYSIQLHKSYHDYRAAYYNLNPQSPDDQRFGPTPDYIPENTDLELLRTNRNYFRNRRDLMYVALGLAYGLNIIDAYVFAHMRTFDVSEDLSMRTTFKPSVTEQLSPGFTLSIELFNRRNATR